MTVDDDFTAVAAPPTAVGGQLMSVGWLTDGGWDPRFRKTTVRGTVLCCKNSCRKVVVPPIQEAASTPQHDRKAPVYHTPWVMVSWGSAHRRRDLVSSTGGPNLEHGQ